MPSKLRFSAKCSFFGQSLSRGHYQPTYQPPEGVYLLNMMISYRFHKFGTTRYTTDFYIRQLRILSNDTVPFIWSFGKMNCFRLSQITLHLPSMAHVLTIWCSMLRNVHPALYFHGLNQWRMTTLVTCLSGNLAFVLLSTLELVCTI